MVCLLVSMYQYTHLYITSNDHSGIGPLLVNKHRLSLKSDLTLQAPNSLSDPDRIPLTYVSVTFTDYRSAFSPTGIASPEKRDEKVSSPENAKKNAKLKRQVVGRSCLDLVLTLS